MRILTYILIVFCLISCNSYSNSQNSELINDDLIEQDEKKEWTWNRHYPDVWSNYPIDTTLTYSFEDAFKKPSGLKVLYINEPKTRSYLPAEISILQDLEELWIWINISDTELFFNQLKELPNLKKLSIRGIRNVPENIAQLKNLEALELNTGSFTTLPNTICNLHQLRFLRLYNTRSLTKLPACLGELVNLEYLDCAGTNIKYFPVEINNWKKLRTIVANGSKIEEVNEMIFDLPKLSYLNLAGNRLKRLPDNLGNLQKLDGLDLGYNQLDELPESVSKMQNLQYIHIDHNKFKVIPEVVFNVKNLQSLWVHENEIKNLPIKDLANSSIQRLLIDIAELKKSELNELKELKPRMKIIDY